MNKGISSIPINLRVYSPHGMEIITKFLPSNAFTALINTRYLCRRWFVLLKRTGFLEQSLDAAITTAVQRAHRFVYREAGGADF